jgi:hypothetical protein
MTVSLMGDPLTHSSARAAKIRLMKLGLTAICLQSGVLHSLGAPRQPTTLSPQQMPPQRSGAVALVPTHVAIYTGKVYAGCGAGLLEIEQGSLKTIHRWDRPQSVIEGPWLDAANGRLWVWLVDQQRMANFDGKTWRTVGFPKPKSGHITRDDELRGFVGLSDGNAFWLIGAGHAWRWAKDRWKEEIGPQVRGGSRDKIAKLWALMPTKSVLYFAMRDGAQPPIILESVAEKFGWYDRLSGDSVYYSEHGQWSCISNSPERFFTAEAIASAEAGYIRTKAGGLLEVRNTKICKLDTPAFCEAVTLSPAGKLTAFFRGLGVYEMDRGWRQLLNSPYPDAGRYYAIRLAVNGQQIALALAPLPWAVDEYGLRDYPCTGVWVSHRGDWKRVALPSMHEESRDH